MSELKKMRDRIDQIDESLWSLLCERFLIIKKIFKEKNQENSKIFAPKREKEIINKIILKSTDAFSQESIVRIFNAIINEGRNIQYQRFSSDLKNTVTFGVLTEDSSYGEELIKDYCDNKEFNNYKIKTISKNDISKDINIDYYVTKLLDKDKFSTSNCPLLFKANITLIDILIKKEEEKIFLLFKMF